MKDHVCELADYCICSSIALEPDEQCPKHGFPFPPRCWICGKFMKYERIK